jgi:hypothetical protein
MKNLCNDCKFMKLKTTNYCIPYEYDEKGNVIYCQSYEAEKKNVISCIINFIKHESN